ncbi:MAG: DUF4288 domain-containing protein [Cytophagales bacterium]|nr:DUF4288 domain-containing protein [Cytophagales bacterium]
MFRIVCGDGNHQVQFDEQLRLLLAADWTGALLKSQAIGEREQCRFLNQRQQWVEWNFIDVAELTCVGSLEDGQELYYQITEPPDADLYIRKVEAQALSIAAHPWKSAS